MCFGPTLERLCAFEWPGAAEQFRAAEVWGVFLDLFFAVFCKAARVVHFWVLLSPCVLVEAMPLNFKKEEGLLRYVKGLSQYAWRNVPTQVCRLKKQTTFHSGCFCWYWSSIMARCRRWPSLSSTARMVERAGCKFLPGWACELSWGPALHSAGICYWQRLRQGVGFWHRRAVPQTHRVLLNFFQRDSWLVWRVDEKDNCPLPRMFHWLKPYCLMAGVSWTCLYWLD